MLLFRGVLLLVAMVSVANSVEAQSQARDQALLLYERAEEHFRAGDHERSTLLLREAIDLVDAAPMHFNLAKSLHETRDLEEARDEYALFLEMEPETPRRAEVEARIAQISAEIAARDATAVAANAAPEPEPEPVVVPGPEEGNEEEGHASARSPAPWIVMASSALPFGGAVVCGVLFSNEVDDARSAPNQQIADEHRRSADSLALAANILYGVGGAVALGGLIWGIVSLSGGGDEDAETPRARLRIGPSYAGIEGTF